MEVIENECIICFSSLTTKDYVLFDQCDHFFCLSCVKLLVLENPRCPLDRLNISVLTCKDHSGRELFQQTITDFTIDSLKEIFQQLFQQLTLKIRKDFQIILSFKNEIKCKIKHTKLTNDNLRKIVEYYSIFCPIKSCENDFDKSSINCFINQLNKLEKQIDLCIFCLNQRNKELFLLKIHLMRIVVFCNIELYHIFKHIENYLNNMVDFVGKGNGFDELVRVLTDSVCLRLDLVDEYFHILHLSNMTDSNNIDNKILASVVDGELSITDNYHSILDSKKKDCNVEVEVLIRQQLDGCSCLLRIFSEVLNNTVEVNQDDKIETKGFNIDLLISNLRLTDHIVSTKHKFSMRALLIHNILSNGDEFEWTHLLTLLIGISELYKETFSLAEKQIIINFHRINGLENDDDDIRLKNDQLGIVNNLECLCSDYVTPQFQVEFDRIVSEIDKMPIIFRKKC